MERWKNNESFFCIHSWSVRVYSWSSPLQVSLFRVYFFLPSLSVCCRDAVALSPQCHVSCSTLFHLPVCRLPIIIPSILLLLLLCLFFSSVSLPSPSLFSTRLLQSPCYPPSIPSVSPFSLSSRLLAGFLCRTSLFLLAFFLLGSDFSFSLSTFTLVTSHFAFFLSFFLLPSYHSFLHSSSLHSAFFFMIFVFFVLVHLLFPSCRFSFVLS